MILDKIIAAKEQQLAKERQVFPLVSLVNKLEHSVLPKPYSLLESIQNAQGLAIIGEVKKASPSQGVICSDFNPVEIAKEYAKNQVAAISVLTEPTYFQGALEYLRDIREVVKIPLLCKDFIVDVYQVYQARLAGADCILLIVAALEQQKLRELYQLALSIGLDCLVEVHNLEELKIALELDAYLIGVNNRDLKTFHTSLDVTEKLVKYIPPGKILVSESGIHTRADFVRLEQLAVDGVLIGESLMRAPDLTSKLQELTGDADGSN